MSANFWGWMLFSFNGRASRMYYWLTVLIIFVIEAVFLGAGYGTFSAASNGDFTSISPLAALCALPVMVVTIWVGLAVSVKRWHDRAKSGWWVLIGLVPIIGSIWVLVECGFLAGTPDVNQYGQSNVPPADPLAGSGTAASAPTPPPAPAAAPDPGAEAAAGAGAVSDTDAEASPPAGKDDNPYAP